MKRLIIILASLVIIQSCEEKGYFLDPTYFMDGFKGITLTAEDGPDPLGGDLTDWCTDCNNYQLPDVNSDSSESEIVTPVCFSFAPCFPNPTNVNGSTKLRYSIAAEMNIKIYMIDKHSTVLKVLVDRIHEPGTYEVTCDLEGLAPDVYRFIAETEYHFCKGDLLIQ